MDIQKIFLFSGFVVFFFFLSSLVQWSNARPRVLSSVGFPTWDCFKKPETESQVPHWPGLPLSFDQVPAPPFAAARPHRHVYSSTEKLAS